MHDEKMKNAMLGIVKEIKKLAGASAIKPFLDKKKPVAVEVSIEQEDEEPVEDRKSYLKKMLVGK